MDPSSSIVAVEGLLEIFSSLLTATSSAATSSTYIREELYASTWRPFGENEKWNASPPGKAADELIDVETSLMNVSRGLK